MKDPHGYGWLILTMLVGICAGISLTIGGLYWLAWKASA